MSRSIHTTRKDFRGLTKREIDEQFDDPNSDLATWAKKKSLKKEALKQRKQNNPNSQNNSSDNVCTKHMNQTSINSKVIQASRQKVYHAFTTRAALEFWLAPYGMTGKIHNFDLKVGGGYEMSLFYNDNETAGKTSGNEDRFSATFVEIKPHEKIIQSINFQSDNDEFKDEMIMEVHLEDSENQSTKVTIIFKNIPTGIDPKDNEEGTEQSLEKLASYLYHNSTD